MSEINVTYEGIEVRYDERENVWRFTLRGRDRSTESLHKAKEAIDKPVSEKVKPFERVEAYKADGWGTGGRFIPVSITSIVEPGRHSYRNEVWITKGKERSKVNAVNVYPATPENTATIEKLSSISAQVKVLADEYHDVSKQLTAYVVAPEPES